MPLRVFGIVLIVLGVILLGFGFNAHDSVADSVKEGITGRYTDRTMGYLIGGAIAAVAGIGLLMSGRGRSLPH
ncbi:MAG TPA: DUF3185 family protein [Planctomycetota bacterium]|nr:DUF3185 family protein [Planctomycetota bacterium]